MKLIIAEKESVGKQFAEVVGATKRMNGYMEGNNYIVTWARGHLLTLCDPEQYDESWKKWANYPVIPETFRLKKTDGVYKQLKIVVDLFKDSRVDEIICGTDAGREGELIFRYIYNYSGVKKKVSRLWCNSLTESEIKKALQNMEDGNSSKYMNLYHSAYCRAKADWLVGINFTRMYSVLYGETLSVGRVQTPTLKMIVDLEKEITGFVKRKHYTITAKAEGGKVELENDTEYESLSDAQVFIDECLKGHDGTVVEATVKDGSKEAPKLFDLAGLQKYCNTKFKYTAKKTLELAQKLYERKILTYPRTDSQYINEAMKEEVAELAEKFKNKYGYEILTDTSKIADDSKVTDHHAILPTENALKDNDLSQEEQNVLECVIKRMICACAPKMTFKKATVKVDINHEEFKGTAKRTVALGWMEIEHENDEESTGKNDAVFSLKENDVLTGISFEGTEHESKPKSRFTDSTLISAMERAGKDEFKKIDGVERVGLGTPATRADIIEKMIRVGYIERKKNHIFPTEKGIALFNVVPEHVASVEMTTTWEEQLASIKKGSLSAEVFDENIKNYVKETCQNNKADEHVSFKKKPKSVGTCPECGGDLVERNGKFGKFVSCSNYPECKYVQKKVKPKQKSTGKKCPECGGDLVERKSSYGKFFGCSNYPECRYAEAKSKKK